MDGAAKELIGRFDQVHVNSLVLYFCSLSFCEMKKCPVVGFLSLVPVFFFSCVSLLLSLVFFYPFVFAGLGNGRALLGT